MLVLNLVLNLMLKLMLKLVLNLMLKLVLKLVLKPVPWCSSGHPSERRLHQGVVCHEDLPDTQHSDHHGVVLEEDHADDARSRPAGEVSRAQETLLRAHCSHGWEVGIVSSPSSPSTQAHWEMETSTTSLFFLVKPLEKKEQL